MFTSLQVFFKLKVKTDDLPYSKDDPLKKLVRKPEFKTFKNPQDSGQDGNTEENRWNTFCREDQTRISNFQLDDLANSLRCNPNSNIKICDIADLTSESYDSAELRSKETIAIINTGKKDDLENQSNHRLTLYKNGKSIVIYDSLGSASNKKDNALDNYLQQDSMIFKQIKRLANDENDGEWTISLYRLGHQRGETYSCGYFAALYRVMVALKKNPESYSFRPPTSISDVKENMKEHALNPLIFGPEEFLNKCVRITKKTKDAQCVQKIVQFR